MHIVLSHDLIHNAHKYFADTVVPLRGLYGKTAQVRPMVILQLHSHRADRLVINKHNIDFLCLNVMLYVLIGLVKRLNIIAQPRHLAVLQKSILGYFNNRGNVLLNRTLHLKGIQLFHYLLSPTISIAITAFWAWSLFSASSKITLRSLSITSSVTSKPLYAGRQCMNILSGFEYENSSLFT